ncbi:MAG: hypothetical protein KKH98_06205 [Spirochaetes bacterium]|nr:hypothetical protein [Spirochaetota bacterium]
MRQQRNFKREGVVPLENDLIRMLSHELKTPLNAIIGFSRMLDEEVIEKLNPKQKSYVKNIINAGENLLSLINDMMDLSGSIDKRSKTNHNLFSIRCLITRLQVLFKEKLLVHNNLLQVSVEKNIDPIRNNEKMIKRVLFELLVHILSTIPDNSRISVKLRKKKRDLIIQIDYPSLDKNEIVTRNINDLHKGDPAVAHYFSSWMKLSRIRELMGQTEGRITLGGSLRDSRKSYQFSLPVGNKKQDLKNE